MRDVNEPIRVAYASALTALGLPVYYQYLPNNLNPDNYLVFRSINNNDVSTKSSSDVSLNITVEIHTKGNVGNQGLTADTIADQVYQLIIQGWRSTAIVRHCSSEWGITERQVQDYIKYARSAIRKRATEIQKNGLKDMLNRHDDLRSRAYKTGDLRLVIDIDREDAKLLGIYAPEKKEIAGKDGEPLQIQMIEVIKDRGDE